MGATGAAVNATLTGRPRAASLDRGGSTMSDESTLITRHRFPVASWDADARGRLAPSALGRYLQEAAGQNAEHLGFGFREMLRRGQAWVLSGLLVRWRTTPRFGDTVEVETWPVGAAGRRALRDFTVRDGSGRPVADVTSAWYCLDIARRRPLPPEAWRRDDWLPDRRAVDRDPGRIDLGDGPSVAETAVPVRWSDLDLNDHLTNTRYQDLVLESFDRDWLHGRALAEIELNFLAEGRYPDTIVCRRLATDSADTWLHQLVSGNTGREIARARTVWRD